jgi:hypothetical protein
MEQLCYGARAAATVAMAGSSQHRAISAIGHRWRIPWVVSDKETLFFASRTQHFSRRWGERVGFLPGCLGMGAHN